ncbi:PilZ domain-containing protein [Stigmatella aurantiaca]|uniref:PilZ-like type IV pilus assembly protein n=1 Tax=Stigmatella aurantiaca (strain DW4/3-1) TaxID=378806 RepID=Q098R7_STIAD|nr:PilZ domain-containing protein [Stigmatella aurantiaca]ADO74125.1 PilZ-like type IV pilus assembly protein [Stigmatella aurantiaca DW4/3-1]EAU68191.1 type IV pilus assembly protein PilZ [Stigmatella aurantiaca DW4/3-1]
MAENKISPASGAEERRESPRVPMRFLVRRAGSEAGFEAYEGDLSLGGCALRGGSLEGGAQVELRLLLPSAPDELRVNGEVLQVTRGEPGVAVRVRFVNLSVEEELAIARHLDDLELTRPQR